VPLWAWLIIVVIVLGAIAFVLRRAMPARRTGELRERFGPEYDRAVEEHGDERTAETALSERVDHRRALEIRPLGEDSRRDYAERWTRIQAMFVDAPQVAVAEADVLVRAVMLERGYPVDDDERRLADLSVDHPDVMDHFRIAMGIAAEAREDRATTERLRQAMVHYRELFTRLLADDDPTERRTA
jgi:hypothetical protein